GFIFLDADKKDYCPLLEPLIALLQPGGIMLVDNLLWHGNAVKPDEEIQPSWLSSTRFVREFNEMFFNHPRLRAILLPVGDGLGLAVKK
ncbi:MAG: O-methyltransferase, partial [Ignavibacteriales bacterium]|nr:O-methyltransferase [Ignavibacteriales bacterium]